MHAMLCVITSLSMWQKSRETKCGLEKWFSKASNKMFLGLIHLHVNPRLSSCLEYASLYHFYVIREKNVFSRPTLNWKRFFGLNKDVLKINSMQYNTLAISVASVRHLVCCMHLYKNLLRYYLNFKQIPFQHK